MKPKIFVVDNEQMIATTFATVLKLHGFDAYHFVDPREALQSAEALRPAILLSDVVMPHLSGIALAIQLRAILPECRIVFISGATASPEFLEEAETHHLDYKFLMKPVHPLELLAQLQSSK